jgi:glycosyltransferase involved in cell wall biosynthesis
LIPNGLNVHRFAGATPEERGRPYLLCVGRLERYKGVQNVIQSLPELPDFDLLVAGAGDYHQELKRVARNEGVTDRVTFLGYVEDERLPRLYAGATAYVTLSEFEAYGMTVAEALASGTPCVVREAGALCNWADRPDCAGVASIKPEAVARAVQDAMDRNTPADPLPTWDDVTDRVLARYK